MPEANPLNSHGRARRLLPWAWAWGGLMATFAVYLLAWHAVWWEMLTTAACLAVTMRCIDVLRRL